MGFIGVFLQIPGASGELPHVSLHDLIPLSFSEIVCYAQKSPDVNS